MAEVRNQRMRWDDPTWAEPRDTPWRAGCRWLQCWWRSEELGEPAGPFDPSKPDGLVGSILPLEAPQRLNFLSLESERAFEDRLTKSGWGGLIREDRVRRNLLSSQPLCFNLFGHLNHHRHVLVAWLNRLGLAATEVVDLRIEWAPPRREHFGGGSAFDAFIHYRTDDGDGFVGIETKYAENLAEQATTDRSVYGTATSDPIHGFRTGAADRLNRPATVQLWLNALLARSLLRRGVDGTQFVEGVAVAVGSRQDTALVDAANAVRSESPDPDGLLLVSDYETIIDLARDDPELSEWVQRFERRYLDYSTVAHRLAGTDPRIRPAPIPIPGEYGDPDAEPPPPGVVEALSWSVVASLTSRYPDEFSISETHPGGGQYDCLTLEPRRLGRHVRRIDLNRAGSAHVHLDDEGLWTWRGFWSAVAEPSSFHDVIGRLCAAAGLPDSPGERPPTASTLACNYIASVLSTRPGTDHHPRCVQEFREPGRSKPWLIRDASGETRVDITSGVVHHPDGQALDLWLQHLGE